MVSQASSDLGIFILTVPGTRDVMSLINTVQKFLNTVPIVVEAITPAALPCGGKHLGGSGRHRNGLSCVEVATSLSHQRARNLASARKCNWSLFLEDDSIVQSSISFLPDLILEIESFGSGEQPVGIHLFPEQFGILRKHTRSLLNVVALPDYAVGYVLNAKALRESEKLAEKIHLSVADWPKGMDQIHWYAPTRSLITHPNLDNHPSQSQIEELRRLRASQSSFSYRFVNYPLLRILVLRLGSLLGMKYGKNWIASERIRSVVLLNRGYN